MNYSDYEKPIEGKKYEEHGNYPEKVWPTTDELQAREILRLKRDKFRQIKDIVLMVGGVILMIGACYILKETSAGAMRAQCEDRGYIKAE